MENMKNMKDKYRETTEDTMMKDHYMYMKTFEGYPQWDQKTKDYALETLTHGYIANHGLVVDASEFIEILEQYIFEDIQYYESIEEYEICTILRDLLDAL